MPNSSDRDEPVAAPRRYRITLMGDTEIALYSSSRTGLLYLLDRLLTGQTIGRRALRHWGISAEIEDDTDGGPEDLSPLIQPADFSRGR